MKRLYGGEGRSVNLVRLSFLLHPLAAYENAISALEKSPGTSDYLLTIINMDAGNIFDIFTQTFVGNFIA